MATIEQMKKRILEILSSRFPDNPVLKESKAKEVQEEGFLLEKHALAIAAACRRDTYSVSFRKAGTATLDRIARGNPCKGHAIMDKSIKPVGGGDRPEWTYTAAPDQLERFVGLVGFGEGSGKELAGLWKNEGNAPVRERLAAIGNDADLSLFYTGDYDMHDLFLHKGGYCRIIAGSPEEESAIDRLNLAILQEESGKDGRKKKVDQSIRTGSQRLRTSEYSLIRHGAQTSFMSYLHTLTGSRDLRDFLRRTDGTNRIPWENSVMNISAPICMFDKDGRIFILHTLQEIYGYYKTRGMLEHIPFYYFFKLLREDRPAGFLDEYAETINCYLRNFCDIQ